MDLLAEVIAAVFRPLRAAVVKDVFTEERFRGLSLHCRQCDVRTVDDITLETVYGVHGNHLRSVTMEVQIIATGTRCRFEPAAVPEA